MCMCVGCVFAGAGGGGFISVLTKGPSSKERIQSIINSNEVRRARSKSSTSVYRITICFQLLSSVETVVGAN